MYVENLKCFFLKDILYIYLLPKAHVNTRTQTYTFTYKKYIQRVGKCTGGREVSKDINSTKTIWIFAYVKRFINPLY